MFTTKEYFARYIRSHAPEFKPEYEKNAEELLNRVNSLFYHLNLFNTERIISSGWRPPSRNKQIKNAAKLSLHMTGKAVDVYDPAKQIAKELLVHVHLIKTYGLWLEKPSFTPTWVHLDIGKRPDRKYWIFNP